LVNDLDIGHELLGKLANGAEGNFNAVLAREFLLNLHTLATFQKPGPANVDDHIVGDGAAGRDKARQSLGAGRW
jgi:hypothetical protein